MIENKNTEFKRMYIDDIKYTIVAFANTDGGKLYIGIDDNNQVVGVTNVYDTMKRVVSTIRDSICPDVSMFTDCDVINMDGKQVVLVQVNRGTSRPYYLKSKGVRPEGVYVRQGPTSVPASQNAILDMIRETSGYVFENERSLNQNLSFDYTSKYFKDYNVEFNENKMRTLGLIGQDGTYSNLGLLLSDQCSYTIKLASFQGSTKSIFRERKEVTGSLLSELNEAYSYIDLHSLIHSEFEGLRRIDRRDYPVEAIREALLNAIIHRDYSIASPILISIFDDRIEILSVGGLLPGFTKEDIMLGVSVLRNKRLADIFYRLELVEAYGTGIMKIKESYQDFDVKPLFEITNNAFKITLPNTNFVNEKIKDEGYILKDVVDRNQIILSMTKYKGFIRRKEVEELLHVSAATANVILKKLVDDSILEKEGSGPNLQYVLKEKK